ncbi:MAG: hypothetical protein Q8M22_10340 [Actinomycetota bacterium]|nr:hypothetical protein [Actinomycetota bacterium]
MLRFERIEAWLEEHKDDDGAAHAMAVWIQAAMADPKAVAHHAFRGERADGRKGRTVWYASVPGANAAVTYIINEYPVRHIVITSISDP